MLKNIKIIRYKHVINADELNVPEVINENMSRLKNVFSP